MKKYLASAFDAYRQYRSFKKRNRAYRIFRYALTGIFAAYFLTLVFPQYLFAHQVSRNNFKVYARQPLDEKINHVLDAAQERLAKSPIYDKDITERIFISDTFAFYIFQSPLSRKSFATTLPVIGNIRINKADVAGDSVFRETQTDNQRSLSGVIAHEVTHNLIRRKFGLADSLVKMPDWKEEGYCEYVAGETTLSFEEGVRRWKENPAEDSKYAYFKYHQMVKYLLDDEKITVEDLFNRDFDLKELEAKVFAKICRN
ncbi:MAG TPA: hypothetical protein VK400_12145 [Pyrinomonadaceae bacterium]|nr:hypothetical protein [Pyrinomonadaceae bacterium]